MRCSGGWVGLPFDATQESPAIYVELNTAAAGGIFQYECDRSGLKAQGFVYEDDFMTMGSDARGRAGRVRSAG